MCVVSFSYFFPFGDTLTSISISCWIMSYNLSFVQLCTMHLNIFTNRTTFLGEYSVLIPKDVVGSLLIGWLTL